MHSIFFSFLQNLKSPSKIYDPLIELGFNYYYILAVVFDIDKSIEAKGMFSSFLPTINKYLHKRDDLITKSNCTLCVEIDCKMSIL